MVKWKEEDNNLLLSFAADFDGYMESSLAEWRSNTSRIIISPGRVLFSIKRMTNVLDENPQVKITIDRIMKLISSRRITWVRKIDQEIPRRLLIWQNALREYMEEGLDSSYKAQVVHRVILDLLEQEARLLPADYQRKKEALDAELKGLISPGQFIWDNELAELFSCDNYWYLYVKLRKG